MRSHSTARQTHQLRRRRGSGPVDRRGAAVRAGARGAARRGGQGDDASRRGRAPGRGGQDRGWLRRCGTPWRGRQRRRRLRRGRQARERGQRRGPRRGRRRGRPSRRGRRRRRRAPRPSAATATWWSPTAMRATTPGRPWRRWAPASPSARCSPSRRRRRRPSWSKARPTTYHDNVYYTRVVTGGEVAYQVVAPPPGAIITTLPAGCTSVQVSGATYSQCGSTHYTKVSTGYQVVVPK